MRFFEVRCIIKMKANFLEGAGFVVHDAIFHVHAMSKKSAEEAVKEESREALEVEIVEIREHGNSEHLQQRAFLAFMQETKRGLI